MEMTDGGDEHSSRLTTIRKRLKRRMELWEGMDITCDRKNIQSSTTLKL
jgi:hypothetical protein